MNDALTLREAAEILGVSAKRVQGMIRQEQLEATMHDTPAGRYQTVARKDVEALAEQRRAVAAGKVKKERPGPKPKVASESNGTL